jgi:hypothetical protein
MARFPVGAEDGLFFMMFGDVLFLNYSYLLAIISEDSIKTKLLGIK